MLKIQIFGIGCRRSKALKKNLLEALNGLPLFSVRLEEITDVDQMIHLNISGAPALVINDQVVAEDAVLSVGEIKDVLEAFTARSAKPFQLKQIIVPIDFSEVSAAAYQYAQSLAHIQGAALKVVHVYHPEYDTSNPYQSEPLGRFDEIKRELLHDFVLNNQLSNGSGAVLTETKITEEVLVGFAADEIVRLSGSASTDMIVMGTTGASNLLERVFGSVSSHVAQKAQCPVVFVPVDAEFTGFKEVLYASSYPKAEQLLIGTVGNFAKLFDARLHFVHILGEEEEEGLIAQQMHAIKVEQLLSRVAGIDQYQLVEMESESIVRGILRYARKNHVDLVTVSTRQRSFLEKIFHRSVTKRMLFSTNLPLMVIHQ
ncbi:MAG: universal stress protein [Phaeodactylibacter sp.]|nr:universal stress protein [Phaeodactylibacter sp.]